jgi:ketosteroid isomerase-like protein
MRGVFTGVLILVLMSLVAPTARSGGPADKGALLAADLAFAKVTAEKGLEGWLSWFAPDAKIFLTGEAVVEGLESVKACYAKNGFDPKELRWKPSGGEMAASGDLGYTYGTASWPGTDEKGNKVTRTGKYLTVWKRQADGSWKVVADIGNPDAPGKADPKVGS